MLYRKNKLGEELELPIFNHYYNVSITALEFYLKNPGQSDTYIITYHLLLPITDGLRPQD